MGNWASPIANMQKRGLRKCSQQLVSGVGREDRRALMVRRIAMHRETLAVDRIEASVCVPRLIEVDPVNARVEQFLDTTGVVAQSVVGGVGNHRIHWALLDSLRQGIRLYGSFDCVFVQPLGRNGADDPISVAKRYEVGRNAAG